MSEQNEQFKPYPPQEPEGSHASKSGSCLMTLFIWFMPSLVVPLIFLFLASARPLAVLIAIAFLVWLGRIQFAEETLEFNPHSGDASNSRWGKVALYVIVQLIWIPLFLCAVLWGFCVLTGSGTFK